MEKNTNVCYLCWVLAIVKSADNSLMSQKLEIILKTAYSDRIGRRIAETNIRSVWRHSSDIFSRMRDCDEKCTLAKQINDSIP
jgi:hypothetical protein